eukprot:1157247-Pelagomonas_calceolata.AAC.15
MDGRKNFYKKSPSVEKEGSIQRACTLRVFGTLLIKILGGGAPMCAWYTSETLGVPRPKIGSLETPYHSEHPLGSINLIKAKHPTQCWADAVHVHVDA